MDLHQQSTQSNRIYNVRIPLSLFITHKAAKENKSIFLSVSVSVSVSVSGHTRTSFTLSLLLQLDSELFSSGIVWLLLLLHSHQKLEQTPSTASSLQTFLAFSSLPP